MPVSFSMLEPATPTAPTTSLFTRGDECRSTPIDVLLDLCRRPLQPRGGSCLLDGEVRACWANTVHPLESKQLPIGINHCDCRGAIALLRALLRCLQDRPSSSLIEDQYAHGLCPD